MVRRRVGRSVPIAFPVPFPVRCPIRHRGAVPVTPLPTALLWGCPMTSTHAHAAQTGRHTRGRAAALRHRPRVGPRPRRVRRRPAPVRAPAAVRRHLRLADAVAAAARRTHATLGRLGRPGHARPRDRRPRPGRAPTARAGRTSPTATTCAPPTPPRRRARPQPPSLGRYRSDPRRGRGGWPQICGYPHRCGYRHSCGQGHGCGQGGRRSAAQPKASDRESSSPHPSTPPAAARTASDGGGGADARSKRRGARPVRHHRPRSARRALPNLPEGARPVRDAVGRPVSARRHPAGGAARLASRADPTRPARPRCGPRDPLPDAAGRGRTVVGPTPTTTSRARRGRPRRPGGRARRRRRTPPRPPSQGPAELAAEHLPVTRATVTARAVQILHRSRQEVA